MSAPFVSGAAALLLAFHPSWNRLQVLDRLSVSARALFDPELDGDLGAGGLAVGAALNPDAPIVVPDDPPAHVRMPP